VFVYSSVEKFKGTIVAHTLHTGRGTLKLDRFF